MARGLVVLRDDVGRLQVAWRRLPLICPASIVGGIRVEAAGHVVVARAADGRELIIVDRCRVRATEAVDGAHAPPVLCCILVVIRMSYELQ